MFRHQIVMILDSRSVLKKNSEVSRTLQTRALDKAWDIN